MGYHDFTYTGAAQPFTIPAGVTSIAITAIGGGGGYGGGGGGNVQASFTVVPNDTLNIYI